MIDLLTARKVAEKHYEKIYLYCLFQLENEYEAEEITQNVFLLFEQKRKTLTDENIKAWLYRVSDILIKEFKRKYRENFTLELIETDLTIHDIIECINKEFPITPEEIEEKKEIIFNSLSEKELKILKMHTEQKKTYKEIAKALNMTEKAVSVCSCRTRKKITEMAKSLTTSWVLLLIKIFF